MNIQMVVNGKVVTASLDDSAATRDFVSRLPLKLTLQDYGGTEKINYLASKLAISGAPEGYTPSSGDIAYYAPWGNLAIFYKGACYARGLVKLGRIEAGATLLSTPGAIEVTIALMPP